MVDAQFSAAPSSTPEGHLESRRGETPAEYNERRVEYLEKAAERESSPLARDLAYAKAAVAIDGEAYERAGEWPARLGTSASGPT